MKQQIGTIDMTPTWGEVGNTRDTKKEPQQ